MENKLGLIHIYTGEGKGKSSSGMGLVVRAIGRGLKVKIIQLFKRDTGEQIFFQKNGIPYDQFKPLHPFFKNYREEELKNLKKEFLDFWKNSTKDIQKYDLVLIDEAGPGISWGIISKELIIKFLDEKPKNTEVILTGRDFPEDLLKKADYVSEIKKIKHPFDRGISARKGVEY